MKKTVILFSSVLLFANFNKDCIIDYNKFKKLSKKNKIISIAKQNCKNVPKNLDLNKYYIDKTKIIVIENKHIKKHNNKKHNNTAVVTNKHNNNLIKSKPAKIKKKKIPLIQILASKPLKDILDYAIKYKITSKEIGNLIIKKAFKYRNDLDYEYVKDIFSSNYTIKDLKMLKEAINNI
jgi:hypothetical protein